MVVLCYLFLDALLDVHYLHPVYYGELSFLWLFMKSIVLFAKNIYIYIYKKQPKTDCQPFSVR